MNTFDLKQMYESTKHLIDPEHEPWMYWEVESPMVTPSSEWVQLPSWNLGMKMPPEIIAKRTATRRASPNGYKGKGNGRGWKLSKEVCAARGKRGPYKPRTKVLT